MSAVLPEPGGPERRQASPSLVAASQRRLKGTVRAKVASVWRRTKFHCVAAKLGGVWNCVRNQGIPHRVHSHSLPNIPTLLTATAFLIAPAGIIYIYLGRYQQALVA